jgi:hypothetical protein
MITNYTNPKSQHLGSFKKTHVFMYVILVLSNENLATFEWEDLLMLLKNTQKLHNCMRNEQFATAQQSLYRQTQLEERVSTHKLSSSLKRFRASWVSTRQWTRTVLNSSMNLSSSSALSAQMRDFDRATEIWQHGFKIGPSASTLRR